jgi:catechol 2,3-dioxygenase-like lactoylglutathione lyase family enzyme
MIRPVPSLALLLAILAPPAPSAAQGEATSSLPPLHHVGLNSLDPEAAIAWYRRLWPTAVRTEFAGEPGVQGEMLLLFQKVASPPPGAWSPAVHRSVPQSAFWHIGAFTNTSTLPQRLAGTGVSSLPLFLSSSDTGSIWRSGQAPYTGTLTAGQLATAPLAAPRDGGFSYVIAPDGVLFEFTGGPATRDALAHVHFFHERPLCAANWYVEHLGMALPPVRDSLGGETPRPPWAPCDVPLGEAGWPSLEPAGTIRTPSGSVRYGNVTMSWYPRQCVRTRCGTDTPFARSRGQALDHIAFEVRDLDALLVRLRRAGVTVLQSPHAFGPTRAAMIEDPDGLAIELVEAMSRD